MVRPLWQSSHMSQALACCSSRSALRASLVHDCTERSDTASSSAMSLTRAGLSRVVQRFPELPVPQRREVVAELAETGMSGESIADVLDVR